MFFAILLSIKIALAFKVLTTFLPVFASNSFMFTLTTFPPYAASILLLLKVLEFTA